MSSFYSLSELSNIGFRKFGTNVLISRYARLYNPQNIEIGSNVRIDDFCFISAKSPVKFGNNVHLSCYTGIWAANSLDIGNNTSISTGSKILTETDDFSGNYLTGPSVPLKYRKLKGQPMKIYPFVNIGANSTILPISEIQEGAVVGACSLVTKPLAAWTIYTGIPAKAVKSRNKGMLDLYQLLINK